MSVMIDIVGPGWGPDSELDRLLHDVLYADFGVPFDGPWRHPGPPGSLAVAYDDQGHLLGTVRLIPGSVPAERQLRQLAVDPSARMRGVGRQLVEWAERTAASEGAEAVVLGARDTAWGFYERLGYAFTGDLFISELTGIPHRPMRKVL